jgi:hypothetical protein
MSNNGLNIAIEYDDLAPHTHQLEYLTKIKEHLPEFKVTLFTIPLDIRYGEPVRITNPEYELWRKAIRACIRDGWMELALHGLTHNYLEFKNLDHDQAVKRLITAERMMREANLPYVKIFKAPHWYVSPEAKEAIQNKHIVHGIGEFGGMEVVEDGYYHWNLKDDMPKPAEMKDVKVMIAHGHVMDGNGCNNGIQETMHKILDLPTDTNFHFISEIL